MNLFKINIKLKFFKYKKIQGDTFVND